MHDTIRTLVEQFWKGLGITLETCETRITGEDIDIRIQTPDSALVIGMHGKSLESFSHILARMIEWVTDSFVHVHLEVNDYIKSKEEKMFRFLDSKIAFIMSTGKSTQIQNLNSYDRKRAHNYISEKKIEKLTTHSEWEWAQRVLVIEYTWELVAPSVISPRQHTPSHTPHHSVDDLSEDGVGI